MTGRCVRVTLVALVALFVPCAARADVAGLVRGTVTQGGATLPGATVTAESDAARATSVTDASGRFTFARLPFGRWTFRVRNGSVRAAASVDVTSDSVADVSLTLTPVTAIGETTAVVHGIGTNPVSATTFGAAQIADAPQRDNLDRFIETVPGIVRFSYDEPVAHGFHGVAYEIDGAPIPQTTSTSFSQIFDPRNVSSIEVLTGAFPAEFGGQRQGALVNIVTPHDAPAPGEATTLLAPAFGTYGVVQGSLSTTVVAGATDLFFAGNTRETTRGLDTPSLTIVHDGASLTDGFIRSVTRLSPNDTLAINLSHQHNSYEIPLNLSATPYDSIVNLPQQNDVQREDNSFATVNFTHTAANGSGYWQVIPWFRYSRVAYAGDLADDVRALDENPDDCGDAGAPCPLAGLAQDRSATVAGLRAAVARNTRVHAFKAGVDGSVENFTSTETIVQAGASPFFDDVAKRGTSFDAYVQDTWTPNDVVSIASGLRYDFSNGFVQGDQFQPRIGVNVRIAPKTIVHAFYGRLYAAPSLEDTRRDAVVVGGGDPNALPVYDLKPQTESSYEFGVGQSFANGLYASLNGWQRNVWNVLDTTQIYPTPIFATYNNSLGLAHGLELRVARSTRRDDWYVSASFSQSVAGGISGGTFLFAPDAVSDTSLQPEDHDQALAVNDAYTLRFGVANRWFATVGSEYGTGYPVAFQNGNGRLTPHLTLDAAVGFAPQRGSAGFRLSALNLTDYQYLIKVNNGFNTTQYAPGIQLLFEGQLAF